MKSNGGIHKSIWCWLFFMFQTFFYLISNAALGGLTKLLLPTDFTIWLYFQYNARKVAQVNFGFINFLLVFLYISLVEISIHFQLTEICCYLYHWTTMVCLNCGLGKLANFRWLWLIYINLLNVINLSTYPSKLI